jgi:hypothetical protein
MDNKKKLLIGILIGLLHVYTFFGFKIVSKSNIGYHINFIIHWHHWLIAFILLVLIFKLSKYEDYLVGYLIVLMIHGLLYDDRFDFKIYKK